MKNSVNSCISSYHKNIVWEASNGEEAEAIANEKEVDIIVSDVMMPGMDGFELCLRLKENMKTSHIFIILLTARTGDENELAGYQSGADCYPDKAFQHGYFKEPGSSICWHCSKNGNRYSCRIEVNAEDLTSSKVDERFLQKAIELVEKNLDNSDYSVEAFSDDMYESNESLPQTANYHGAETHRIYPKHPFKESCRITDSYGTDRY